MGYKSAIALGHESYYPRFGFIPDSKWNIKATFDVPKDAFMGMELIKNGLAQVGGTVVYPKEFGMV